MNSILKFLGNVFNWKNMVTALIASPDVIHSWLPIAPPGLCAALAVIVRCFFPTTTTPPPPPVCPIAPAPAPPAAPNAAPTNGKIGAFLFAFLALSIFLGVSGCAIFQRPIPASCVQCVDDYLNSVGLVKADKVEKLKPTPTPTPDNTE